MSTAKEYTVTEAQAQFEDWYVQNAFDYAANPIGSRDCGLMRRAWHAALATRQPVRIYGCCAQPEGELHTAECPNMRHIAARQPGAQVPRADLVPGIVRCAKCAFQLARTTLYMGSGTVGAGDSKTEPCPNGCGPLWPVTWETWAREGWAEAERLHMEKAAAPPAQGIDLTYIRDLASSWRTVKMREGMGWREAVSHCADNLDVALALIDNPLDAAPGVGNG
mgnify:FL=1